MLRNGASLARFEGRRLHNGLLRSNWQETGANAGPGARGFIGIAFRVQATASNTTTSGRRMGGRMTRFAEPHDQYAAHPEFRFDRLRKESPEKYESYVDWQPGVWTKYRIVIDGQGPAVRPWAAQPCLIGQRYEVWRFGGAVPCCRAARKATSPI